MDRLDLEHFGRVRGETHAKWFVSKNAASVSAADYVINSFFEELDDKDFALVLDALIEGYREYKETVV